MNIITRGFGDTMITRGYGIVPFYGDLIELSLYIARTKEINLER